MNRAGHDWLVDWQPTGTRCTGTGMVQTQDVASLRRNIARRIEVSMQLDATGTTDKTATGSAVVAGGMPTAATGLRGMSRVNRNHRTTPSLGFVQGKGFELGKRPAMHAAAGFGALPDLRALPNVGQVFQHNRSARFDCRNDLLTQHMIVVAPEARLFPAYPLQVALGRLRALLLQGALQVKQLAFNRFPCPLAQEAIGTRDGGPHDAKINTDNLICRCDFRRG